MADKTAIEWADATVNPIRARRQTVTTDGTIESHTGWHCEHVSEGCRNCYAEALNRDRFGTGLDYKPGHLVAKGGTVEIELVDRALTDMLRWRRPRRIFVCSMTDLFADFVPDWMIDRVFAAMALCPQHTFQVLTKRPERMRDYFTTCPSALRRGAVIEQMHAAMRATGAVRFTAIPWPLPNVWLGVTAEDQTRADERVPVLLETPAAKRFVSVEPMLGAVDLAAWLDPEETCDGCDDGSMGCAGHCKRDDIPRNEQCPWKRAVQVITEHGPYGDDGAPFNVTSEVITLDWVICGGESGPNARPRHPVWVRSLRDQCAAAGVAFFDKQQGEWAARSKAPTKWSQARCARNDGTFVSMDDYDPSTCEILFDVGKRAAGRLLDGVEHLAFPET